MVIVRRLTPFSWPAYRWGAFDSFKRFLTVHHQHYLPPWNNNDSHRVIDFDRWHQ
jgi:hypothetical protein